MSPSRFASLLAALVTLGIGSARAGEKPFTLDVWPGVAPGEKGDIGEEKDTTKSGDQLIAGKPVIRLGNVSKPTLTVYKPDPAKDTGAAVLVCPGGGYHILAMDLEGTEVCEWLNSIGVTGILLKYRVPARSGQPKHLAPLQDAQRATGLVRQKAAEWRIDPRRLGILGFSAGGHLSALVSTGEQTRSYPVVDGADAIACRPDFAVLIYAARLTMKDEGDRIAPELKIGPETPPTFLAMTADDPVRLETALFYTKALNDARVPVELHVYPSGGHGYGLRPTEQTVTTWPQRVEDWMKSRGLLKRP